MHLMQYRINYNDSKSIVRDIEFIGMPAVGKTTLMRKIVSLENNYFDMNLFIPQNHLTRQFFKLGSILLCFLTMPRISFRDTGVIIRSKQRCITDFMNVLSNWFMIQRLILFRKKKNDYIYLWDQAIFQGIWSILFSSQRKVVIKDLLYQKKLPEIIVFKDIENSFLIENAKKRNSLMRLDYTNKEEIQRARKALEQVLELISELGYNPETYSLSSY